MPRRVHGNADPRDEAALRRFLRTVAEELDAAPRRHAETLGAGSATYTVTHNLDTRDVIVQVYQAASPFGPATPTISRVDVNSVEIDFGGPTADDYRVVVIG